MSRQSLWIIVVLVGLLSLLPLLGGAYALRIGTFASMYAILAVSWNVIGGMAGYPSFATAAFFGFGAYAGGILLAGGASLISAMAVAGLMAFVAAAILGAILLRLKGHYFAIASLAVAEVLRELTNAATELTGGGMGLNIPLSSVVTSVEGEARFFFYVMWALLLVTLIVVIGIERSKLGFGLRCICQNESAADMIGVNSTLYKSLAFGFSGIFVAMAGVIYAGWAHYIEPPDVYDILYSVKPIVMALLGGLGSTLGALMGAFLFLGIEEFVWRKLLDLHTGVLGLLIVLLLLFLPKGLVSFGSSWLGKRLIRQHGGSRD
jgi:branched-chain amino acid transport system permease protein